MLVAAGILVLCGAAPRISDIPPSADADVPLSDGRTLHVYELPLARLDGTVLDGATFDTTGTRVVLLARFPNGAIDGDWRRASPTQAYVADISRRTLTALTTDGEATAIRWSGTSRVTVTDAGRPTGFDVGAALKASGSRASLDRVTASTSGDLVSPSDEFRLQVLKESTGAYALGQVGAVRLRMIALANDHRDALVGSFVAWVDSSKHGGAPFSRIGSDDTLPPSFSDDAYGQALTPILPLGHLTYQGAYRNGIAYFAFAYGLQRIVAATTDFVTYSYPSLPAQPDFTVGDGFGAGADGVLYFADPENGVVQIWRNGKYVEYPLTFPADVSDTGRLFSAMSHLTNGDALFPPVMPEQDALEAAIMEWRIYPLGDVTGQGWVASYLGRAYVAGADRKFHEIAEPAFPFAVLTRTDDGRIWGASASSRSIRAGTVLKSSSNIWVSRDGTHWTSDGVVAGSPGAIGQLGGKTWAAMSVFEGDVPGVEIEQVGAGSVPRTPLGAIYAGEDLFFADIAGTWYLVCGGEPGTRDDDTSGALVSLALDPAALTSGSPNYDVRFRRANGWSSTPAAAAFAHPSVGALQGLEVPPHPTIIDVDPPGSQTCCSWMTPDDLQRYQLEFAWTPYPLARVTSSINGDTATVTRTLERGPLNVEGQKERWHRDASGQWTLSDILSRWKF